jgi:hypothetical protein
MAMAYGIVAIMDVLKPNIPKLSKIMPHLA